MPVIAAVTAAVVLLAAATSTMAVMGVMMMGDGHAGMMGWGRGDVDQTPVVSSDREVTVEIRDFTFYPADLTIDAGTRVTWLNRDSVAHTATNKPGAWDTGYLDKGDTYSFVFDSAGSYSYFCRPHPYMVGTITVR
jgi:plastocyanin